LSRVDKCKTPDPLLENLGVGYKDGERKWYESVEKEKDAQSIPSLDAEDSADRIVTNWATLKLFSS